MLYIAVETCQSGFVLGRPAGSSVRSPAVARRMALGEDWPAPQVQNEARDVGDDQLILTEENVIEVIEDMKEVLGQVFGYDPESAKAGITGGVEFDSIEGPIVVISFSGEFWHRRVDVLQRCENYMIKRIPEIAAVEISDANMLIDNKDKGIYHYKD
eukprot:CAMPEP_0178403314 /NCGR_PEP_ID=MMETSP0689_2-20121128/17303_1 /TAXON_ID=160604 /ORGANISM="Amphidinium massartii, Strain CS-259" /LENGTH=156 /DNA_ID=CAMNT_0020024261 /DNA_START=181 /DNA_END=651 /DNA_ORIENTATION=+